MAGRTERIEDDFSAMLQAAGYPPDVANACAAALPHESHHSSHADYRTMYNRSETRASHLT